MGGERSDTGSTPHRDPANQEQSAVNLGFARPHMVRLPAMTMPWEAIVTGADQMRLAKWADQLGYAMIAIPEHQVIPRGHVAVATSTTGAASQISA